MTDAQVATDRLLGMELRNGWRIIDRIEPTQSQTGGNFSVGFLAVDNSGRRGFVKAMDFGRILGTNEEQALDTLEFFLDSFNYEKRLLSKCAERRLSRVVRLLDSGFVQIEDSEIKYPRVDYLICEIANGDVRQFLDFSAGIDVVWCTRCLHQTAVGIQQLHTARISHQDLKPSNVLMFEEGRQAKLADLGRAVDQDMEAPYEDFDIPGDRGYAPPELLYGYVSPEWGMRRLACDLYHLGSLGFFLFTGTHAVTAMLTEVHPAHRPYHFEDSPWQGPFEEVLPFLEEATARNLADLGEHLQTVTTSEVSEGLVRTIGYLCAPDPGKRGHPRDRSSHTRYSVQRFVGTFNTLTARARAHVLRKSM